MKLKSWKKCIALASAALCVLLVFSAAGCKKGCGGGKNGNVTTVTINLRAVTLELWGEAKLTATSTGSPVTWSSSDASTVPVDKDGNIAGIKSGFATVTASADGVSQSCRVTVIDAGYAPLLSTEVLNNEIFLLAGDEYILLPVVTYNLEFVSDSSFRYGALENDGVISVGADGKITALKSGTAKVAVTGAWKNYVVESLYAEIAVTVY